MKLQQKSHFRTPGAFDKSLEKDTTNLVKCSITF